MMQALIDELRKPQYQGMSHAAAAAAINSLRVTVRRPVPTWAVRQAAIEGGFWAPLVLARESQVPAVRSLAISVLSWIDDPSGTIQTVDFDRPATVSMRASLVAAGIVTQAQADSLAALANVTIPWTESVGLPEIGIGLVINARRV